MTHDHIPPVSDETLAELLELEAKATPGEWESNRKDGESTHWFDIEGPNDEEITSLTEVHIRWIHPDHVNAASAHYAQCEANGEFIAASRNSLRSIVRELQERRAAEKTKRYGDIQRHSYVPDEKYPWFCAHCGYAQHESLKHLPTEPARAEKEPQ